MRKKTISSLNDKQKQAVTLLDKPVLVIAGPGTGKTKILTHKIAHILTTTDAKPSEILALTFTESATTNIKERLFDLIGPAAYDVDIFTFHGFCNYIRQVYSDTYFQDTQDFRILSEIEKVQIAKQVVYKLLTKIPHLVGRSDITSKLYKILDFLAQIKREGITPQDFGKIIEIEAHVLENIPKKSTRSKSGISGKYKAQEEYVNKLRDFLKFYKAYQERLQELRLLDFEDLINIVLEKLETNPDFRLNLQERYQYVLVDEYQDTNRAQNKLVFTLGSYWGPTANVFAVGDDDQAIFRFQGASVENMIEFYEFFKQPELVVLDTNYRSPQSLIDAAQDVSKNITFSISAYLQVNKNFKAVKNVTTPTVHVREFTHTLDELDFIVKKITDLKNQGVKLEDIAILVRRNKQASAIIQALNRAKIPYTKTGGVNIFDRPLINQFLKLLKLVANLTNPNVADGLLYEIIHYKWISQVSPLTLLKIARAYNLFKYKNKTKDYGFMEFIQSRQAKEFLEQTGAKPEDIAKIIDFLKQLAAWHTMLTTNGTLHTIHAIFKESGLLDFILQLPEKYDIIAAFTMLFEHISLMVTNDRGITLDQILELIDMFQRYNMRLIAYNILSPQNAVRIMTVHSAKGLEFDHVFIFDANSKTWEESRGNYSLITLPSYALRAGSATQQDIEKRIQEVNKPDKKARELRKQLKIDDERRLFYVALTRAKQHVYVTTAHKALKNGQLQNQILTRFAQEIQPEHKDHKVISKQPHLDDKMLVTILSANYTPDYLGFKFADKDYIKQIVSGLRISPSLIRSFLTDKQDFYMSYILRVPQPPSGPAAYGQAFHHALKVAHQQFAKTGKLPDLSILEQEFQQKLYETPLSETNLKFFYDKGLKELKKYYKTRLQSAPLLPTLALEQGAYAKLAGVPLYGRIDKIEILDDSPGSSLVQIVDYKTERFESQNSVLGNTKTAQSKFIADFGPYKLLQLYFYKLLFDLSPRLNEYGKWQAIRGVIDFVTSTDHTNDGIVTVDFDPIKYEELKQLIADVYQQILSLKWLEELE